MSSGLLTRTTAPRAVRFMYLCFQRGVLDAYAAGSDLDTEEFYNDRMEDWGFATLTYPDYLDWKAFRSQLYWWAREHKMTVLAESYIFRIRTMNYTWCLLPYCMRFYLMGIREWLDYPNPARIEMFRQSTNAHWNPNLTLKTMTRMDIISYLHTFEFDFRRAEDLQLGVSETAMSTFISALYDLSRKYVTGTTEEDL